MGIKDLFKGSAEGLISGVTNGAANIISKLKADPTKVLEYEKELEELRVNSTLKAEELANNLETAYLQDTQNSRDNNAKIQESDKASWMAKNIAYMLDIVFTVSFIAMLFVIIYKQVPESNKELFYTSFGLLGGYVSQILGFHRGSSIGSKESNKMMRETIKNLK